MTLFWTVLALSALLIVSKPIHSNLTTKTGSSGHSTHTGAIPRVGGLALVLGLLGARYQHPELGLIKDALGFGLVVFGIGLIEDVTHSISPRHRLFMCLIGGLLAAGLGGYVVRSVGLSWVDAVLEVHQVALLFTAFAIAGLCSAVNIIDGKNGLAAGSVMLSLGGLGMVSMHTGQSSLAATCMVVLPLIGGFLVVNWPWGLLFMGDCGAYLLGFTLALGLIDLASSGAASPWASLVLVIYPVTEVLHSIWRRSRRAVGVHAPDTLHLHNLAQVFIDKFLVQRLGRTGRNSCVAPFLLIFQLPSTVLAVVCAGSTGSLMVVAATSAALQIAAYKGLESFANKH